MPKMTSDRIEFLPNDRETPGEQSPGIDKDRYSTIFTQAATQGETQEYFKLLEEIAEKDPDVLQTIETRTAYVTAKEWEIVDADADDGEEQDDNAIKIENALKEIPGDKFEGLLSTDELIASLLGSSYLTGLSFSEIITNDKKITGFNHIPAHFLTFKNSVHYPQLWTQEQPLGVNFNREKMISHYLSSDTDPARGYLGNAVAWQYVFKRTNLDERLRFEKKYGKSFLLLQMPRGRDGFEDNWSAAEDIVNNVDDVDGAVLEGGVEADFIESGQPEGDYFFNAEESFKSNITRIILGQDSTSSSQDSNRSTADVHMEVLEQRTLDDIQAIQDTLNMQLIPKIKTLLGIAEDSAYKFQFIISELEATLDEEMEEEGAVEETESNTGQTQEVTSEDDDE